MKRFFTKHNARRLLAISLLIALLVFLYIIRPVLGIFLLAIVLAYLLYRPVLYFESKGLTRTWAILLVYLLLFGGLALLIGTGVPAMVNEFKDLVSSIPEYADQTQQQIKRLEEMQIPDKLTETLYDSMDKLEIAFYDSVSKFMQAIYGFFSKMFALIIAPILAFYMMHDWNKIRNRLLSLISPRSRRELVVLLEDIDEVLMEFIKGYLIVALFVGTMTGLSAFLLGVKFPVFIGFVAGLTNMIPYFGPFLGGIPAVGIALTVSAKTALYMLIAILIIQQIESAIVTPNVMGGKLGMHPLVIVFVLLTGAQLFGIWGMLLAVPVTAVLRVLLIWIHLRLVG